MNAIKMLITLVRLAARNMRRNRARTVLTMGMVMLGVGLLVIGTAWIQGIMGDTLVRATNMAGHVRVVTSQFAAREALMPLDEHLTDTDALVARLAAAPGVIEVAPRISTGVTVSAGDEIGDVFAMVVGAPLTWFERRLGARDKLVAGGWFTGAKDELILGSKVAERAKAKVGDEVILLGVTRDGSMSPIKGRLVGVVGGVAGGVDSQILAPLEAIRWLTDIEDGAVELLVYGEGYRDAAALAVSLRQVQAASGAGQGALDIKAWSERDPWASMLKATEGMQNIIVFIIVFLTALGIWNTMMMSVLERTHEIGVLRAMGLTRAGTVALFVLEALAIAVIGGLAGLVLGGVPSWLLETHGLHMGAEVAAKMSATMPIGETVYADLTASGLVNAFVLGLVIAFLGSVLPSMRAAGIQPVAAMRSGR